MKICFVYEYYHPHVGGAEALLQHLAEGMADRGHKVSVVTSRLKGTPKHEIINGVRVRRVTVPLFAERYWFTVLGVPAVLKEVSDADIIHTGTYNGAMAAWLAGKLGKKPVVLQPFEVLGDLWSKLGLSAAAARSFRLFERSVLLLPFAGYSCISKSTWDSLVKVCGARVGDKAFVSYPGIDYQLFDSTFDNGRDRIRKLLAVGEDTFLCLYSGRPGYIKGLEYLIKAFPRIKETVPAARLLLLLARDPANKYREAVEALSRLPEDDIILRDPVPRDELPSYFQASDCVIIPSLNEGFGFTCVEACAMGRPVVVTRAGSLPEVVSGRFVIAEPADAGSLAEGVARVFRCDYQETPEKRFSWDDSVDDHLQVYERLLSGSKPVPEGHGPV